MYLILLFTERESSVVARIDQFPRHDPSHAVLALTNRPGIFRRHVLVIGCQLAAFSCEVRLDFLNLRTKIVRNVDKPCRCNGSPGKLGIRSIMA